MPLDKQKIVTRYTRKNKETGVNEYKPLTEPPMCGVCGRRITVAELLGEQFEAVQGKTGRLAYYHRNCLGMEARGHD